MFVWYLGILLCFTRGLEYENGVQGKQPMVESENKAKYGFWLMLYLVMSCTYIVYIFSSLCNVNFIFFVFVITPKHLILWKTTNMFATLTVEIEQ